MQQEEPALAPMTKVTDPANTVEPSLPGSGLMQPAPQNPVIDAAAATSSEPPLSTALVVHTEAGTSAQPTPPPLASGVMRPDLFYTPKNYLEIPKLQGVCDVANTIKLIENTLSEGDIKWFTKHPQFQHIFHCPREDNHKVTGMWLLLVRTAKVSKKRERWFVVNGVPIRYSMREHALISGLDCRYYPKDDETLGDLKFVQKYFSDPKKIRVKNVEKVLKTMHSGVNRTKMVLLLFLSTVILPNSKSTAPIDSWLLKVVDDLNACRTYPWGRKSFFQCVKEIDHMIDHFKGIIHSHWKFPGFIIPLELLAFECIPRLRENFRKEVICESDDCPRMCRSTWQKNYLKGFPMEKIYETLGTTKDICSVLTPRPLETPFMLNLMEYDVAGPDYDDDKVENMVDSWNKNLFEGKKICWEMLYEADIATRGQAVTRMDRVGGKEPKVEVGSLKGLEAKIMEKVDQGFELLHNMVAGLQSQLDHLRETVADLQASDREENKEEEREEEKEEEREEDKEEDEEEEVQPLKRNRKPKTKLPSTPLEEPEGKRKRLRSKALGSPFTEEKKKKEKEAPKKKTRKR